MAYVDSDYYKNTFKGNVIPDEGLDYNLEIASDNIDSLTYNSIVASGLNNLTAFQQDKIKKAICFQAEFLYQYGDYINFPLNSYTAGSIQLNFNTVKGCNSITTNINVLNYLKQTGLTNRVL